MHPPLRKICKRYNIPGHTHFLTFSCFRRQQFLNRDRTRRWFLNALRDSLIDLDYSLFAWVIMPEHVHLLVTPRQHVYSMSDFLSAIKTPVARRALRHVRVHAPAFLEKMLDVQPNGKSSHRFWQRGGGYDTNLWTAKYIVDKINYIHHNPVRRGLVKDPAEWEWSSAKDFARMREPPLLPLDHESLSWQW